MSEGRFETWKTEKLRNFRLYAVTDVKDEDPRLPEKIDAACRGGADIIQLRSKRLSDSRLYRLGEKIKPIVESRRCLFFINDRPDLALALGADGVHLGQDDMPVSSVRALSARLKQPLFIGKSTHSLEQAVRTSQEEVDYIGFGPVFGTPTKPDYVPVGTGEIGEVLSRAGIPVVFIGGIDISNIQSLMERGARRFAVVRAIFGQGDAYESARQLRQLIEQASLEPAR